MNTLFAKQYKLRILNGIATLDCTGLRRMCQGIGTWHHHPRGREMPRPLHHDGYSSKDGQSINSVATDSKSINSLGYHIPLLNNHRRNQRKAFGTTYQFYIWRSKK